MYVIYAMLYYELIIRVPGVCTQVMDLLDIVTDFLSQTSPTSFIESTRDVIAFATWSTLVSTDNIGVLDHLLVDLSLPEDKDEAVTFKLHITNRGCDCVQCRVIVELRKHVSKCHCVACSLTKAIATVPIDNQPVLLEAMVEACRHPELLVRLNQDRANLIHTGYTDINVSINAFVLMVIHNLLLQGYSNYRRTTSIYIQHLRGLIQGLYIIAQAGQEAVKLEGSFSGSCKLLLELSRDAQNFFKFSGHNKSCSCLHVACRIVRHNFFKHLPRCKSPFCIVCAVQHRFGAKTVFQKMDVEVLVGDLLLLTETLDRLEYTCNYKLSEIFNGHQLFDKHFGPATIAYLMYLHQHCQVHSVQLPCSVPFCEHYKIIQEANKTYQDDQWLSSLLVGQQLYDQLAKLHKICGGSGKCQVCKHLHSLKSVHPHTFLLDQGIEDTIGHIMVSLRDLLHIKAFNNCDMTFKTTKDITTSYDTNFLLCATISHMLGQCRRNRDKYGINYCTDGVQFCNKWYDRLMEWVHWTEHDESRSIPVFDQIFPEVSTIICDSRLHSGQACIDPNCLFCSYVANFNRVIPAKGFTGKLNHLTVQIASRSSTTYAKQLNNLHFDKLLFEIIVILVQHRGSCNQPCDFPGCHAIWNIESSHEYINCQGSFTCGDIVCRTLDTISLHQVVCQLPSCTLCHLLKNGSSGIDDREAVKNRVSQLMSFMPGQLSNDPDQVLQEIGILFRDLDEYLTTSRFSILNLHDKAIQEFNLRMVPLYMVLDHLLQTFKGKTVFGWYKAASRYYANFFSKTPIMATILQRTLRTIVKGFYRHLCDGFNPAEPVSTPFKSFAKRELAISRFRKICHRFEERVSHQRCKMWSRLVLRVIKDNSDQAVWRRVAKRLEKEKRANIGTTSELKDAYAEIVSLREQVKRLEIADKQSRNLRKDLEKTRAYRDELLQHRDQVKGVLRFVGTIDTQLARVHTKVRALGLHKYQAFYTEFQSLMELTHPKHLNV